MTVISITAQNFRLKTWNDGLGVSNIGGGPSGAAEPSFPYSSPNAYNRKVTSSSGAGWFYDPTANGKGQVNMLAAGLGTFMAKVIVTDPGGLQAADGARIRIGNDGSNYYMYVIAGTDAKVTSFQEYPPTLGYIFCPINPNVAFFRNASIGTVNLLVIDYLAVVAAFSSSTAKSENVGISALDFYQGLTITGGGTPDPKAGFLDLSTWDEGITTNRFGGARRRGKVVFIYGTIQIGSSGVATVFENIYPAIFPDNMAAPGYNNILANIQNAGTIITFPQSITGEGTKAGSDTRPDFTVVGTAGLCYIDAPLNAFRNITLTSGARCRGGAVLDCDSLVQANAVIVDTTIKTRSVATVSSLQDPNFGNLTNSDIYQFGTGHGVRILEGAGNVSLVGVNSIGYGIDNSDSAFIHYLGVTPINLSYSNCNKPTVKGLITVLDATYNVTFNNVPLGVEVTIKRGSSRIFHIQETVSETIVFPTQLTGITVNYIFTGAGIIKTLEGPLQLIAQNQIVPLQFSNPDSYI